LQFLQRACLTHATPHAIATPRADFGDRFPRNVPIVTANVRLNASADIHPLRVQRDRKRANA
jgi:hypothetical protein